MHIRFISTLTAEDEDRLAQTIIETAKGLLATFPVGYLLRIETTGSRVFEHNGVPRPPDMSDEHAPLRMLKKV